MGKISVRQMVIMLSFYNNLTENQHKEDNQVRSNHSTNNYIHSELGINRIVHDSHLEGSNLVR